MRFDAIVLAGGAGARLGGVDKPALELAGQSLLSRVLDAVAAADRVVVVGPRRDVGTEVTWCREDPPGGGPLAALAAALPHTEAPLVLLLAADMPGIAPAVPSLLAIPPTAGAVALGPPTNLLASGWRRPALLAAVAAVGPPAGAPMRALTRYATIVEVRDDAGWSEDCDTWADVERAERRLNGT